MGHIHLEGVEDLTLVVDRITAALHGDEIVQIFQLLGEHVADRAREIVQVKTGALEGAIFAKAYFRDGNPYVIVGVETHEPGHGHQVVYYAGFVEFGTVHMEAHPFIRRAADESEETVTTLGAEAIRKLLLEAARA